MYLIWYINKIFVLKKNSLWTIETRNKMDKLKIISQIRVELILIIGLLISYAYVQTGIYLSILRYFYFLYTYNLYT